MSNTIDKIAISDVLVPLSYLPTGFQETFLEIMDEEPLLAIARHMNIETEEMNTQDEVRDTIIENLPGY